MNQQSVWRFVNCFETYALSQRSWVVNYNTLALTIEYIWQEIRLTTGELQRQIKKQLIIGQTIVIYRLPMIQSITTIS